MGLGWDLGVPDPQDPFPSRDFQLEFEESMENRHGGDLWGLILGILDLFPESRDGVGWKELRDHPILPHTFCDPGLFLGHSRDPGAATGSLGIPWNFSRFGEISTGFFFQFWGDFHGIFPGLGRHPLDFPSFG